MALINGHFSINSPNGENNISLPCDFKFTSLLWTQDPKDHHIELHMNGEFSDDAPLQERHFRVFRNGIDISEITNKQPIKLGGIQDPRDFTYYTVYEIKE